MFFRRKAARERATEALYDPAYRAAGRRLDLPLRMAASINRTLAQFSAAEHLTQREADAAVRLVGRAIDVRCGGSAEDAVADALDRVEWTVPLVKVARDRALWDEFWNNAIAETRVEQWLAVAEIEAARQVEMHERRQRERREQDHHEQDQERQAREREQRRRDRLWEEECQERERHDRAWEERRSGLGEQSTVERAAFVFHVCGVPDTDRLGAGELRAAWIKLMKDHHPDGGRSTVNVQEANAAYEVLRDREG